MNSVYVAIQKNNGRQYVSIRQSFWDSDRKKSSTRTIKNYGRLDLLEQKDPDFLKKANAEAEALRKAASEKKWSDFYGRMDGMFDGTDPGLNSDGYAREVMLGSCVYRQVWNKLDLSRKLRNIQRDGSTRFDFPDAAFYMTAARAIMPGSKLHQWMSRNQYLYSAEKLKLIHLYRSVDLLCENKESIIRYINRQIAKVYNRVVSIALYDVTTFYFESQEDDDLRKFGFSKDNKVNQVQVVMGLLIDDRGIPVDYELFPGNTNEFGTMIPILSRLRSQYGIGKVIVVADRGLNSGSNLLAIKKLGMEYVIAYRLKGAGKAIRNLISESGWQHFMFGTGTDATRYKITEETRVVYLEDSKVPLTSRLLINYSARRAAKDAHDRDRLVRKAERYANNPSLLQTDMHRGGKSYLKIVSGKIEGAVDEDRIERAKFFDGYYGIVYSDPSMSPEQVLAVHHSLWRIEQSFRIQKSLFKARPCFHWKPRRVRGHFMICYLALVMHRLLELELESKGLHLSSERIVAALSKAHLVELSHPEKEAVYVKGGLKEGEEDDSDFRAISSAVGLGKLYKYTPAKGLKQALHLKYL